MLSYFGQTSVKEPHFHVKMLLLVHVKLSVLAYDKCLGEGFYGFTNSMTSSLSFEQIFIFIFIY